MRLLIVCLFLSLFQIGCKSSDSKVNNSFDRKKLLENYAQNLIKPAYSDLQAQVNSLKTASDNFLNTTNTDNLIALQNAWVNAYSSFQYANAYNFGIAGEQGLNKSLVEEIATFPVSTSKIETAITNNTANFNDFNRDARGFLAIEYLIFDISGNQQNIISNFSNNIRKNYLRDAINNLKNKTDIVAAAWSGTYYNEFIQNTGTDAGSSTSQLYNEFIRSFETIKNLKLGIPLGKSLGQIQTEPQRVEAYYSGKSVEMMKLHFQAIESIWHGKAKDGVDGIGFKEYLESVEGGKALINSTENQLLVIKNQLNSIPNTPSLSVQIQTNPAPLESLHTELQRHTRFFKSDMSSLLGIYITYSSGDGD
ncbi:MAG: imelysin family protein [Raineya sp.]|nr:imelysin family protein [Raineya sp.]